VSADGHALQGRGARSWGHSAHFAATSLEDSSPHAPSRLARPSRPREEETSTSQGHPRTIFRRALERGNLVLAQVTAREIGRVTIAEALELTALVGRKQPARYGRLAARRLCLYLEEHEKATLEDVELIVFNLRSPPAAGERPRTSYPRLEPGTGSVLGVRLASRARASLARTWVGCQARWAGGGVTVTTTSGGRADGGQLATRCSCRPTATASRREWTLSAFRMWRMWFRTVSMLRWSSCAI